MWLLAPAIAAQLCLLRCLRAAALEVSELFSRPLSVPVQGQGGKVGDVHLGLDEAGLASQVRTAAGLTHS